jgi:hypothetical protein
MTKVNGKRAAITKALPNVERSSSGLRSALFDQLDGLRAKTTSVQDVNATARLAAGIIGTWQIEIEASKLLQKGGTKEIVPLQIRPKQARLA